MPTNINSSIKLYVDDVLIYRPIRLPDDIKCLQEDLNTIEQWALRWQARFNPGKCEHIRITNTKNSILSTYTIQSTIIQAVPNVTYLGVTINEHLSWSSHIANITKKANAIRGFLQRNIKSCPPLVKENCYKLMIRPIIEYAPTVWAPYLQKDILKLESVQRRSARFVLNDEMLTRNENPTRGHSQRYCIPPMRINAYHHSFFPSTIRKWNTLPDCIITSGNIELFISNYYNYYN